MKIQTRRGLRAARNATVAAAAVAGLVLGSTGSANAEVNDQNRIVSNGVEIAVSQADTNIWGVPPIGGSPLSREWFHDGQAVVNVTGESAEDFSGTVQFGYQVAWPAAVDGSIGFDWSSPDPSFKVKNSQVDKYKPVMDRNEKYVEGGDEPEFIQRTDEKTGAPLFELDEEGSAVKTDQTLTVKSILPQAGVGVELTPAPGIEELVVAEGPIEGDYKEIRIAASHGAAAGVIGPVSLRPFVRVLSENGDSVTTYGKVWTL
ncbi:MspA family porin [Rhodococcus zopfii]|uniref:MspA family porin n=1 Tax=Rhodococcus zopfii TaxID=43772 RepID=UPI003527E9F1